VLFPVRLRVVRPVLLPVLVRALLLVQDRHRNRQCPDIPVDYCANIATHYVDRVLDTVPDQVPGLVAVPALLPVLFPAPALGLLRVLDPELFLVLGLALALVQLLVPGRVRLPAQLLALDRVPFLVLDRALLHVPECCSKCWPEFLSEWRSQL
jgi:hypothetical protein